MDAEWRRPLDLLHRTWGCLQSSRWLVIVSSCTMTTHYIAIDVRGVQRAPAGSAVQSKLSVMMYSCLHGKRSSTCSTSANQSPTSRHGVISDLLVGDCWTCRIRGGVHLPGGLSPWLARWCGTRCRTTWKTRQSAETFCKHPKTFLFAVYWYTFSALEVLRRCAIWIYVLLT